MGSIICVFSHMINEIVILWCKSVVLHVRPYRFIVLVNDGVGFRRVNATQSLNGHERGRSTNRGVPRSERTRAHIVSSSQLWINLYSFFFSFFIPAFHHGFHIALQWHNYSVYLYPFLLFLFSHSFYFLSVYSFPTKDS